MARFKIESNGGLTRVWDRDSGEEIKNVVKVEFTHTLDEGVQTFVTVRDLESDITITTGSGREVREITSINDKVRKFAEVT